MDSTYCFRKRSMHTWDSSKLHADMNSSTASQKSHESQRWDRKASVFAILTIFQFDSPCFLISQGGTQNSQFRYAKFIRRFKILISRNKKFYLESCQSGKKRGRKRDDERKARTARKSPSEKLFSREMSRTTLPSPSGKTNRGFIFSPFLSKARMFHQVYGSEALYINNALTVSVSGKGRILLEGK